MVDIRFRGAIYKITNIVTGKIYVGKKKNITPGYMGSGSILGLSKKKHGLENFKREILEICNWSMSHMKYREQFWIAELDARNPLIGYNILPGDSDFGDSMSNHPRKDEIYAKIVKNKRSKIGKDGLTGYERSSKNRKITMVSDINEDGLTSFKRIGRQIATTITTPDDNGVRRIDEILKLVSASKAHEAFIEYPELFQHKIHHVITSNKGTVVEYDETHYIYFFNQTKIERKINLLKRLLEADNNEISYYHQKKLTTITLIIE